MSRAITVKSLLELDQAQLLKLLIERRGQDEAFDVHVTDLDALSSKERELLATKLQYVTVCELKKAPIANS